MVEGFGDEVIVFGGVFIAIACGLIGVLLASLLHREDRTPAAVLDLDPPTSPRADGHPADDGGGAPAAAGAAVDTGGARDAIEENDGADTFAITAKLIGAAGVPAQLELRVGRAMSVGGLRAQILARANLSVTAGALRTARIIFRGAELHDGDARLVALGFVDGTVTHAVVAVAPAAAPPAATGADAAGAPLPPLGQLPPLPSQEAIVLSATFGGFLGCMYLYGLCGSRGFAFFDPAALASLLFLSAAYYVGGGVRVLAACFRHEAARWQARGQQGRRRPHAD